MKRKILALALAVMMLFTLAIPAMAFAIPEGAVQLSGKSFNDQNLDSWINVFSATPATKGVHYYKFVFSNKTGNADSAVIEFVDDKGDLHEFVWNDSMGFSTNPGGNNSGIVVKTPITWELSGEPEKWNGYAIGSNIGNFNLSGRTTIPDDPNGGFKGGFTVDKNVVTDSGITPIDIWFQDSADKYSNLDYADLISGISFNIYAADATGKAPDLTQAAIATGTIGLLSNMIDWGEFQPASLPSGKYFIVETLSGIAATVFQPIDDVPFDRDATLDKIAEFEVNNIAKPTSGSISASVNLSGKYDYLTYTNWYKKQQTQNYLYEIQPYFYNVWKRPTTLIGDGTLVTRLTYSDNTAKATPKNGGAFKNGHTYVKVSVADATNGVNFTIADSSPNNGKKTPDKYNVPFEGYTYNVKLTDGILTVTLNDNSAKGKVISGNIGAYVSLTEAGFPGNAPKHSPTSFDVKMPKGTYTEFYLYTHIEGPVEYLNENDAYVKVKEVACDSVRSERKNDGDPIPAADLFIERTLTSRVETPIAFRGTNNLVVTNSNGDVIYSGVITGFAGSELAFDTYTLILTVDGLENPITKEVTIDADNADKAVDFGSIVVTYADETNPTDLNDYVEGINTLDGTSRDVTLEKTHCLTHEDIYLN